MTELLQSYGYWGMFLAGFLAGSFIPFSSEAVMLALIGSGLDPVRLVVYASAGNILGAMFNYGIGRMGNIMWIEKYLRVSEKKLRATMRFMEGRGAWIGALSFLPIIGSAITIALGFTRANPLISLASISVGKVGRYILLICGTHAIGLS